MVSSFSLQSSSYSHGLSGGHASHHSSQTTLNPLNHQPKAEREKEKEREREKDRDKVEGGNKEENANKESKLNTKERTLPNTLAQVTPTQSSGTTAGGNTGVSPPAMAGRLLSPTLPNSSVALPLATNVLDYAYKQKVKHKSPSNTNNANSNANTTNAAPHYHGQKYRTRH